MPRGSRVSPEPFDMLISSNGFMLNTDRDGRPIYSQQKMPFIRNVVTPGANPYAVADPRLEAPRVFSKFHGGMGFQEENLDPNQDNPGYRYGLYIDSGNRRIENGPAVNSVTPTQTGNVRRFFELNVGGTRKLCALAGQYVKVRDADTAAGWVTAQDLGLGAAPRRVEVFRGNQARDVAFIAIGATSNYWVWDGASNTTVFTQDADDQAIAFVRWRYYLYNLDDAANGYRLRVSSNGGSTASWGGDFIVTDLANPVTDMAVWDDRLYIGSEQGLLAPAVSDAGQLEYVTDELTPAFKFQRNADNGLGMQPWYQWLFVPMAGTLFRYGGGEFVEMGLGTLQGNTSEVQGVPTAIAGYGHWTLFVTFYNAQENASYLMRWGSWQMIETPEGLRRVFVPAWHGALYKWSGVRINAMHVTETPGGNPRLYCGDDTGVIHYFVLPRYSMDWASDPNTVRNTTNPGQVFFPVVHHALPNEDKVNLAVGIFGENLSGSTRYIDLVYRTIPTGAFSGAANIDGNGRFSVDPGQRRDFTTNVSSRMIELRATLTTTTGGTGVHLKTMAIYQAVRPTFKWVYSWQNRVGNGVIDHHGQPMGRYFGEDEQVQALEDAASSSGPVTIVTPRGDTVEMVLTNLGMQPVAKRAREPLEWIATVEAIQHRALTTTGTWTRVYYHTWTSVYQYTWAQLANL